ncbi:NADPH-dependent F420 reductase [Chitinophaga hostae]
MMNIGIIGAGAIGGGLASKLVKLGHAVSIANSRGPASLQQLAATTGATAVTAEEATQNKQVIIVAIPQKSIADLPKSLFRHLPEEVVVIETGNYYPNLRDGVIPALEQSGIDSKWVQEQLGVPVVKVFNSIIAESLIEGGKPKGAKDRIALAVSGDDPAAKEVVFKLVDELGFDPFDVGTIARSWMQQPGSPVYCRDLGIGELKRRVDTMAAQAGMKEMVSAKRLTDEALMKKDYPAYLKSLLDPVF